MEAWKSPPNSWHRENCQTFHPYTNKRPQNACCSIFEALSVMRVFNLTYYSPDSTQSNRKTIMTTKGFLFLLEKNIHFYLIPLPGLTLRTNDDHCKLKKYPRYKACWENISTNLPVIPRGTRNALLVGRCFLSNTAKQENRLQKEAINTVCFRYSSMSDKCGRDL